MLRGPRDHRRFGQEDTCCPRNIVEDELGDLDAVGESSHVLMLMSEVRGTNASRRCPHSALYRTPAALENARSPALDHWIGNTKESKLRKLQNAL